MKKILAGMGLLGLCALCCGLPTFLLGAGIAGVSLGLWGWGAAVAAVLIMIVFFIFKKKKTTCQTCHSGGSCGCKSH